MNRDEIICHCMGITRGEIEDAIKADKKYNGSPLIIKADNMEDAVNKAKEVSQKGDVVTLSPACASFDAYPNFALRGDHYKKIVNNL